MRISPQQQALMLEMAEEQTRLDGLSARAACLPERRALERLEKKLADGTASAARSRLQASDINRDVERLEADIARLLQREKFNRAQLSRTSDKFERRELERDLATISRRRQRVSQELEHVRTMREAYRVDAHQGADAAEIRDEIDHARQRLADVENDLKVRMLSARRRIDDISQQLSAPARKLYDSRAQANGIPVARIDGRACQSCFMELDVATLRDFDVAAADEITLCPECSAIVVRPATLAAAKEDNR